MIGFGDEDSNFVAELTYNYGVRAYDAGNCHIATLIKDSNVYNQMKTTKASSDCLFCGRQNWGKVYRAHTKLTSSKSSTPTKNQLSLDNPYPNLTRV